MKQVLSLFEYEKIKIGDKFSVLNKTISYKMAKEILIYEKNQKKDIFKWEYGYLKAQSWVGIISIDNLQIEILPKLDKINEVGDTRNNLLFMLTIAGEVPFRINNVGGLSKLNNSFLEIFISILINKIMNLLKRGIVSDYKRIEENSPFVKGRIVIKEQLRKNFINKNRFYIEFDEFTADNIINRIIKATVMKIINYSKSFSNKKSLQIIADTLSDVDYKSFNKNEFGTTIYNRKNQEYEEVISMCKLFWQEELPDFKVGKINTFSLLFDMNMIYEKFIRNSLILFKNDVRKLGIGVDEKKGYKHMLYNENNKGVFRLYPDIIVKDINNHEPVMIIDTKWKILRKEKINFGVGQTDIYQMYAYAREFKVKNVILLYPKVENQSSLPIYKNSLQDTFKIHIRTVDLLNIKKNFYNNFKNELLELVNIT